MARRSGTLTALALALAWSASLTWPGAAAGSGSSGYNVKSSFVDLGGFVASSVPLNGTVRLDIGAIIAVGLTNLSITDQLPAGLVVANPSNVTLYGDFLGASVTAVAGSSTIIVSVPYLLMGPGDVMVNVIGTTPATKTDNLTSINSDSGAPVFVTDATIDVVAPPSVSTES